MLKQTPGPDMLIDVVNEHNEVIGQTKRKDIFLQSGGFRTVHVFVFNGRGELLLQQQSRKRDRAPLTWGSSVAAYLFSGESYEEAARRRLKQELNIYPEELVDIGVIRTSDLGHDKFVGLISCTWDGPLVIEADHIERTKFMAVARVKNALDNGRIPYTSTFKDLFRYYLNYNAEPGSRKFRSN